jgi:hypothetical protein
MARRRRLHSQVAAYLRSQMGTGSNTKTKNALQKLYQYVQHGYVLIQSDRLQIENTLLGLLNDVSVDEKVRRWTLATLALVGRKDQCTYAIQQIIRNFNEEPKVLTAAIAALYKFDPENAGALVTGMNALSPTMINLAALQSIDRSILLPNDFVVDIERAEPLELQQSLILVGLDKAPANLFDPNHSNKKLVFELGQHTQPMVAQYSIWAAAENPNLSSKDVGIDFRDLAGQPANVRSYAYRLFAGDQVKTSVNHEVICMGSKDRDHEARLGLSVGISSTFYDSISEVAVDWFYEEEAADIQLNILDHIVSNSEKEPEYARIGLEEFEQASNDAEKRSRMLAAAAGTELHGEFRRVEHSEEAGLFGNNGVFNMTVNNNNTNISNSTVGAFAQGGDAENSGNLDFNLTQKQKTQVENTLNEIEQNMPNIPVIDGIKREALEAASKAKSEPSKGNLQNLISVLEKANGALSAVEGMAGHAVKVATWLSALGSFLV